MCWLLYLIPKNYLSYYFGKIAKVRLPKTPMTWVLRKFCQKFGVLVDEAARDLSEYESFQDFFVRDLRLGVRVIEPGLVSPVDGRIVEFGEIRSGRLIQVKKREYRISDLLKDTILAEKFEGAFYITIYLAPGDYHHIHSPVDGSILKAIYIPGKLWPVNDWSIRNIKNLFVENERVVSVIESEGILLALVKVGATNVGSISVSYDSFVSNADPKLGKGGHGVAKFNYPKPKSVQCGEKIATFNLGSTVVLLIEKGKFKPSRLCQTGKIKMGQSLGSLHYS